MGHFPHFPQASNAFLPTQGTIAAIHIWGSSVGIRHGFEFWRQSDLGSNPDPDTYQLCNSRQASHAFWAFAVPSIKWGGWYFIGGCECQWDSTHKVLSEQWGLNKPPSLYPVVFPAWELGGHLCSLQWPELHGFFSPMSYYKNFKHIEKFQIVQWTPIYLSGRFHN